MKQELRTINLLLRFKSLPLLFVGNSFLGYSTGSSTLFQAPLKYITESLVKKLSKSKTYIYLALVKDDNA